LVLSRITEPTSKLDALRVLDEAGVAAPSYATLKRRPADLRETLVAQGHLGGVREACRARASQSGALPRLHALLRDRSG